MQQKDFSDRYRSMNLGFCVAGFVINLAFRELTQSEFRMFLFTLVSMIAYYGVVRFYRKLN